MAESRIPDANVRIAAFAKVELNDLVERVSTHRRDLKVGDRALMSALILAACRLPVEAVAAVLATYWNQEEERAAVLVACEFIHRMAPDQRHIATLPLRVDHEEVED